MHDERKLGREGGPKIEYLQYGNHKHAFVHDESQPLRKIGVDENGEPVLSRRRSVQQSCDTCARENVAFRELASNGWFQLEEKMRRLTSYRAYNQKWTFDARKMVLSAEVVFEDKDGEVYVERPDARGPLESILDTEAAEELLAGLTEDEKQVIKLTAEDYKPREIAAKRGEKNSDRVRQLKYAALRKLGAPVNKNMRRVS